MKKLCLIGTILTLFCMSYVVAQCYGGMTGTGSSTDPCIVTTCLELNATRFNLTAYYELANNIDCSDTVNWDGGQGFLPLSTSADKFLGSFDGKEYNISELYINRTTGFIGLFGAVDAIIKNLGLLDVNITTTGSFVGALAASQYQGFINNSFSTGTVSGHNFVGGLLGIASLGSTENCYSKADVTGTGWRIGGLISGIGGLGSGDHLISNCYAAGDVIGDGDSIGGLAGGALSLNVNITNSYASGNVTGSANYTGGLIGYNRARIENSYATGDVSGSSYYVGGFIGWAGSNDVNKSYSTGSVNGGEMVGSFIGESFAYINNSFSAGLVTSTGSNVSGFVGYYSNGEISNSYWDVCRTQQDNCTGNSGDPEGCYKKNTQTLRYTDYFYNIANEPMASWDFTDDWDNSCDPTAYPILQGIADQSCDASSDPCGELGLGEWVIPEFSTTSIILAIIIIGIGTIFIAQKKKV